MKNLFLILMSLCLVVTSCKDKEEEPDTPSKTRTPSLKLEFGYLDNFSVRAYADQNTINADSINHYDNFAVMITENNLSTSEPLEFDSLKFSYSLSTTADQEFFIGGVNANQFALSLSEFGSIRDIYAEYYMPVKISATATPNNDTLEIDGSSDNITMTYISQHSSQSGTITATIVP